MNKWEEALKRFNRVDEALKDEKYEIIKDELKSFGMKRDSLISLITDVGYNLSHDFEVDGAEYITLYRNFAHRMENSWDVFESIKFKSLLAVFRELRKSANSLYSKIDSWNNKGTMPYFLRKSIGMGVTHVYGR